MISTYDPRKISISLGSHSVSGYAEDSFVTIEKNGEGISKIVGCDGEIVRNINPDLTYTLKLKLLASSPTNAFLWNKYTKDLSSGQGTFPVLISDLRGKAEFSAAVVWVVKPAKRIFGRTAENMEWELETGAASWELE
ncbi:MAG: DUF3277 domain-containing protein [Clostridia bacterium]|nr:DUF3277 domain-containing protein [Clostridia bacterium]